MKAHAWMEHNNGRFKEQEATRTPFEKERIMGTHHRRKKESVPSQFSLMANFGQTRPNPNLNLLPSLSPAVQKDQAQSGITDHGDRRGKERSSQNSH